MTDSDLATNCDTAEQYRKMLADKPKDQTEWDRVYGLISHWAQRAQAAEDKLSAQQWQPIATAPKGGALVDILNDGRRYAGCHYDRICDEFRHITACGTLIQLKQATHWMPLPGSPA